MKGLISHAGRFCLIVIHYEREDKANREKTDHGSSESTTWTFCLDIELDSNVCLCKFNNNVLYIHMCIQTHTVLPAVFPLYTWEGENSECADTHAINSLTQINKALPFVKPCCPQWEYYSATACKQARSDTYWISGSRGVTGEQGLCADECTLHEERGREVKEGRRQGERWPAILLGMPFHGLQPPSFARATVMMLPHHCCWASWWQRPKRGCGGGARAGEWHKGW